MTDKKQIRKLNAPHYKHWQALYAALYSHALYVDVGKRWRGMGIRYLLCVLMLATIPLSTKIMLHTYQYIDNSVLYPMSSLPTIQIDNGTVLIDKPLPYFIKDRHNEVVAMVTRFDTMENLLMYYPNLSLLITINKLYFKTPDFPDLIISTKEKKSQPIYEKSFENVAHEIFHGSDWVKSLKVQSFTWIMVLSIYPITIFFFFGLLSTMVMLLALFGQITARIMLNYQLKYRQACRLIAVCSTLPMYMFFILVSIMDPNTSRSSLYILGVVAIYFYAAVLSLKRETQKIARN